MSAPHPPPPPPSRFSRALTSLNARVAHSFLGRHFRLQDSGHLLARPGALFTTEIRAGLVTAASMLYIIAVNASILSSTGGPCVCPSTAPACATSPTLHPEAYAACKASLQRDYVTSTSFIATLTTFLLGVLANVPFGAAPGLGVNAYFAYSVVGADGGGQVAYGDALGAVFLEGWIFVLLTLLGLRQWVGRLLPRSLNLAVGSGIGLFLCLIGLGPSGLSLLSGSSSTLLTLGGCPDAAKDASTGFCTGEELRDPRLWLGVLLGGLLTAFLLVYRVRGALLYPLLLVAIASWPRSSSVTLFPSTPEADERFSFFSHVATFHPYTLLSPSNVSFNYASGRVWLALISFLYVDVLDTTGTMFAMSRQAGLLSDASGDFEGSTAAFLVDALCISLGAVFANTSPSTVFVESAAGIAEGGKTGLTAVTTAFVFFLSLFFAPIFASIPSYATGSVLILVGSMMAANTALIHWGHPKDAIPAFLALALIPFTFNIAYGIIPAILLWILLHNVPPFLHWATRGLVPMPQGWDEAEPYSIALLANAGIDIDSDDSSSSKKSKAHRILLALLPAYLRRMLAGKRDFWRMDEQELQAYARQRAAQRAQAQGVALRSTPATMPAPAVTEADDMRIAEESIEEKKMEEGDVVAHVSKG